MTNSDVIQIVLMGLLVVVTGIYAWRTHVISKATNEQADASVKMAEEMREQRVMASRPVIIQKAVPAKYIVERDISDAFEIYNAGNGPAIEVQVILLDDSKKSLDGIREGFLRAGELPMKFYPTLSPNLQKFYIVAEYQGISSHSPKPTWYQTWLPCKLSITGKVIGGKLEFLEVTEEKRIGIFKSEFNNGSKPK